MTLQHLLKCWKSVIDNKIFFKRKNCFSKILPSIQCYSWFNQTVSKNRYYGQWSSQRPTDSAGVQIRLIESLRLRFWIKIREKKIIFEPFPFPSCITGVILSVLIGGRIRIDFFVFLTLSIKMASVAITTLTLVRFSSECRVNFNWIDSSWWCTSRGVLQPIPGIVLKNKVRRPLHFRFETGTSGYYFIQEISNFSIIKKLSLKIFILAQKQ